MPAAVAAVAAAAAAGSFLSLELMTPNSKAGTSTKTEMLVLYKNIINQVEPEDAVILTSTQLWLVAEKKRDQESDGGGFRRASTAVEKSGNSKRTAEIGYGE